MRLIDADALLKEWRLECGGSCFIRKDKYCMHYDRTKGICTLIIKAPTVEPIKHGRWTQVWHGKLLPWDTTCCSVCGAEAFYDEVSGYYKSGYCPNCGAKMDEVEE